MGGEREKKKSRGQIFLREGHVAKSMGHPSILEALGGGGRGEGLGGREN